MNNKIYFTNGERLAALNEYLEYNLETGKVSVYKPKKNIPDEKFFNERLKYQAWYGENFKSKRKFKSEDYQKIIKYINSCKLQPAYKSYLLSYYYAKLNDDKDAYLNAEDYISHKPDFYDAYYSKYRIMRDKGEYMDAIVALEEMLQTSTITPYYKYLAKLDMIQMYDKLLENKVDQLYIDKINKLAYEIKDDLSQYFIDEDTRKDLDLIKSIQDKYKD